ncbi:MAG TPA: TIGR01777 family oxidoreductase [Tepidisphaeraceae bacterium]|nr:TIGR01777 family oxidoreductase [Tepidisphaeraceae bacterium]
MRIILAGGSGFIGRAIAEVAVARGTEVVVLTRSPARWRGAGRAEEWDGRTVGEWAGLVDGAEAVVNLAGKNVNCRYTQKNLREIDESRVEAVRVMGEAVARAKVKPRVLIQASTTAIYGDRGDVWCDETTEAGEGIPPLTAMKWERAFEEAATPGTRRVLMRMGFVLGRGGGVLGMLSKMVRCFLGGAAGSGRQYISWIHIDDLVGIVMRAIEDEGMEGTYNIATPNPVTNAELMRELRRALRRPWSPAVPGWLVRVGCFVLRTEAVLALTGRRARVDRLVGTGFEFRYLELRSALLHSVGVAGAQS